MYNLFRYCAFGTFVVCNAIIATAAIWNLSLIHGAAFSAPRQHAAYSVFVGISGLVIIFPILFAELAGMYVFLTRVWFELVWVGLYALLELVGAVLSTAAGQDRLCSAVSASRNSTAICTSSRLLQAFSWICSIVLLIHFLMLTIFTMLKVRDDPTIWHCNVRKFQWQKTLFPLKGDPCTPSSPTPRAMSGKPPPSEFAANFAVPRSQSRNTNDVPTLAAPRPKRPANQQAMQTQILSYRAGLSGEYDIEHYHPTQPIPRQGHDDERRPEFHRRQASMLAARAHSANSDPSFYPEHMRRVLDAMPTSASTAASSHGPEPSLIGDWPQRDAPVRRLGDRHRQRTPGNTTTSSHTRAYSDSAEQLFGRAISPQQHARPSVGPAGPRRPSLPPRQDGGSFPSAGLRGAHPPAAEAFRFPYR